MIIIQSASYSPAFNLAAEEFLFSNCKDDILFLYVNTASVIIGRNQIVEAEVDVNFCIEQQIPVFRRMSGGGAVYHDEGNLNYCFISNKAEGEYALGSEFLKPIVCALKCLEINVEIGERHDLWLVDGSKISGTASHIGKFRKLHHGTILYDANLSMLKQSLSPIKLPIPIKRGIASVPSPVKNIRSVISDTEAGSMNTNEFLENIKIHLIQQFQIQSVKSFSSSDINEILIHQKKYISLI